MKNKLTDLNDHLFAQLERLAEEDLTTEELEAEVRRGSAMVAVADRILQHASLQVKAAEVLASVGADPDPLLRALRATEPRVINGPTKQ